MTIVDSHPKLGLSSAMLLLGLTFDDSGFFAKKEKTDGCTGI